MLRLGWGDSKDCTVPVVININYSLCIFYSHLVGEFGSELCAVTALETVSFGGNTGMNACYETCIDSIPNLSSGTIPVCGGYNAGLCDLIDSLDINSLHSSWSCTGGFPDSSPCTWTDVSCDGSSQVSKIGIDISTLSGMITSTALQLYCYYTRCIPGYVLFCMYTIFCIVV